MGLASMDAEATEPSLGRRLTRVETSIAGIAAEQRSMDVTLNKVMSSIERLADRVQESGQPKWNILGTWAGVTITVVAMLMGGMIFYFDSRIAAEDRLFQTQIDCLTGRLEQKPSKEFFDRAG